MFEGVKLYQRLEMVSVWQKQSDEGKNYVAAATEVVLKHGYLRSQYCFPGTDTIIKVRMKNVTKMLRKSCGEDYEFLVFCVGAGLGDRNRFPGGGRKSIILDLDQITMVHFWYLRYMVKKQLSNKDMLSVA